MTENILTGPRWTLSEFPDPHSSLTSLYHTANEQQWDPIKSIDWSIEVDPEIRHFSELSDPILNGKAGRNWSEQEKRKYFRSYLGLTVSQLIHAEQGSLRIGSQLVELAPNIDASLYAAAHAADEARHVSVFSRYLDLKVKARFEVAEPIRRLFGQALAETRWDVKFIYLQLIENYGVSYMSSLRSVLKEPLLDSILDLVLKDELRHSTFPRVVIQDVYHEMSEPERKEREEIIVVATRILIDEWNLSRSMIEMFSFHAEDDRSIYDIYDTSDFTLNYRSSIVQRVRNSVGRIGLLSKRVDRELESMLLPKMRPQKSLV